MKLIASNGSLRSSTLLCIRCKCRQSNGASPEVCSKIASSSVAFEGKFTYRNVIFLISLPHLMQVSPRITAPSSSSQASPGLTGSIAILARYAPRHSLLRHPICTHAALRTLSTAHRERRPGQTRCFSAPWHPTLPDSGQRTGHQLRCASWTEPRTLWAASARASTAGPPAPGSCA
jgi:hypothetical protein